MLLPYTPDEPVAAVPATTSGQPVSSFPVRTTMLKTSLVLLACAASVAAQSASGNQTAAAARLAPVITVDGEDFHSWPEYLNSSQFNELGLRCGLPPIIAPPTEAPSDCSFGSTTIQPQFQPQNGSLIQIAVVVHVIMNNAGQGNISDQQVMNQIAILNEDFRAITGSNGANGTDTLVQFFLADVDPSGNPTNGITRSTNNTWFADGGNYFNTLAWDTNRYLNIYTNTAGGALGYVPNLPQGGLAGSNQDRVVVLWSSFGLNAPIGPPYNKGRTTTHEVGHYLGLYHTFDGGCAPIGGCYSNGDRICDTNPEVSPNFSPCSRSTCGNPDPSDNYMDYSDDLCMQQFTAEQANRMRCTIDGYRPNLPSAPAICLAPSVVGRNAGPNVQAYTASAATIGQATTFTVDTMGFQFATIIGVTQANNTPLDSGYIALIRVVRPLSFRIGPLAGPIATSTSIIANDPSLCGMTIYTQAKLHDVATGPAPFILTNSQDITLGL